MNNDRSLLGEKELKWLKDAQQGFKIVTTSTRKT